MSEQKQSTLTSIGSNKKEKKVKEVSKTVRFTITLGESTEESCPEYNYRDLLRSAEKKRKTKLKPDCQVNGTNPFPDDEDEEELKQLARKYEEKYGVSRKKHGRYIDYVDLGAGYDETDPFIDNTDAYDEVVPEEMTTAHGGFYINCGALEFKEVSDQSDVEESKDIKNKKRIKKALALPDGDDGGDGGEDGVKDDSLKASSVPPPVKKQKLVLGKTDLLKKQKFASHDREILKKKRRRAIDLIKRKSPTVKELLKEKREYLESANPPVPEPEVDVKLPQLEAKKIEIKNPVVDVKKLIAEPKKLNPPPAPKAPSNTITDVIESVVSAARGDDELSKDSGSSVSKSASASVSDSDVSQDAEMDPVGAETDVIDKEDHKEKTEEKLPENLPEDMRELVSALKAAARTADGKCKFFSAEVNQMVLSLEYKCQQLSCNNRHQVYSHLASSLPCTKDTLMKRAKKLRLEAEEDKIKLPLRRLKNAIDKIMPIVLENYTKECQKIIGERGIDNLPTKSSDSEDAEIEMKNAKFPKRRFPWTEELRFNLCEVVRIKLQCIDLQKPRKERMDEIMHNFLAEKVKPLWPTGWMKVSILQRESKDVYTSSLLKKKKSLTLPRKIPGPPSSSQPQPSLLNTNGAASNVNTGLKVARSIGLGALNQTNTTSAKPQPLTTAKAKLDLNSTTFHHGTLGNILPRTKSAPVVQNPVQSSAAPIPTNQTVTNSASVTPVNSSSNGSGVRSSSQGSSGNKVGVSHLLSNSPVKVKSGGDVFMRQTVSGKSSPTYPPERPSPSVSVASVIPCKTKGGVDIVPSKGLDLTISGGSKQSLPSVSSSTSKINSEISIIPVTVSSQTVSSQKSPALSLANLPDCISVTPAVSTSVQPSNTLGNTKAVLSLKQRILQDSTKERTRSPINVSSLPLPANLEEEGIEVIEIINDNSTFFEPQKSDNFRQDDVRNMPHSKVKSEVRKRKRVISKEIPSSGVTESLHSTSELKLQQSKIFQKNSDKQLNEETAAATDILNQMLNESLINVSNPPSKECNANEGKQTSSSANAKVFTPLQSSKSEHDKNLQEKEEKETEMKKIIDSEKMINDAVANSESKQSAADIEIGKEISRVMKSIVELQNMSGEDTSQTVDKYTQPRNSAVSVLPIGNSKTSHLKSTTDSEDANMVSVHSSPKSATELGKTNILFSAFQEEFQKHVFRDSTIAEIENLNFKAGKGAITISAIPQQGSTAAKHSPFTIEGSQSRLGSSSSRNQSTAVSGSQGPKPASVNQESYNESSFSGRQTGSSMLAGFQDGKTALSSQTAGANQHSPSYS